MPKKYFEGLTHQKSIFVLRGLKHNSFVKTIKSLPQGTNIIIDPTLFRKYGVKSVPQILLTEGKKFDAMRGMVGIDYALREFAKSGDLSDLAIDMLEERACG